MNWFSRVITRVFQQGIQSKQTEDWIVKKLVQNQWFRNFVHERERRKRMQKKLKRNEKKPMR